MSSKIMIHWRRINLLLILPSQWERLDMHWTGTASHLSEDTHTHTLTNIILHQTEVRQPVWDLNEQCEAEQRSRDAAH